MRQQSLPACCSAAFEACMASQHFKNQLGEGCSCKMHIMKCDCIVRLVDGQVFDMRKQIRSQAGAR